MEKDKFVLTAESSTHKVCLEISAESTIHEFLEACRVLALGLTYSEHSWRDAVEEAVENYADLDKLERL